MEEYLLANFLLSGQQWRKKALCATDDELRPWFTADVIPLDIRRQLRELCGRCPVQQECMESAQGSPKATAGIWGGRSFNQWGGSRDEDPTPHRKSDDSGPKRGGSRDEDPTPHRKSDDSGPKRGGSRDEAPTPPQKSNDSDKRGS